MVTTQEARVYQAFYTKSTPIVEYMVGKLQLKPSDRIFEPCGGDGVFVEALLNKNERALIDIYELNETSIKTLNRKFSEYPYVTIKQSDTLLDDDLHFNAAFGGVYDKIIANPPYGAWQDYDKRHTLKKMFPDIYSKETYALFLYRCIELLKEDGLLTFIIPDTFLNLHSHKALRQHILTRTKIIKLALFPSAFFPGVNFGYANLSIITLQKCRNKTACLSNTFKVVSEFKNVEQLTMDLEKTVKHDRYFQKEIYSNPDSAFLITNNEKVINTIHNTPLTIGDMAHCVTGFYSGNDKQFLKVMSHDIKNGKAYSLIDKNTIHTEY